MPPRHPQARLLLASTLVWLALTGAAAAQTFNEQTKLRAHDAAEYDSFGSRVSLSGDTLLVGAVGYHSDEGAAYVFVRSGTTWSEQAKLLASDATGSDYFGLSVSLAGDTAVVGAERHSHGGLNQGGAAYVFVRTGSSWIQQAELRASDAAANDWFGCSVSISGDTVLVGAVNDDVNKGAAYVFVRSGTTWTQEAKLVASNAEIGQSLGSGVALDGDTALAGAPAGGFIGPDLGAAYVFVRSGGVWSEQAELIASDASRNVDFGFSLSLAGNTALIGAGSDNGSRGSAYVFVRGGTLWTEQAKLVASDATPNDGFGTVALAGDTALIGAGGAHSGGNMRGAAYVFARTGTIWTQRARLTGRDAVDYSNFGGVTLSGDRAVVGASGENSCAGRGTGSVYAFGPELLPAPPRVDVVTPYHIDGLIPGTAQTVTLTGTDLDRVTQLLFDCTPVDPARYTIVSPTRITVDMPQAPATGNNHLAVTDGVYTDEITIDIGNPFVPQYQLGSGDPLNVIDHDNGLSFILCRGGGDVLYVYASFSSVPSVSSYVTLDLGNHFSQLIKLGRYVMPASAWLQVNVPILPDPGLAGLVLYSQAILFQPYPPFRASNLQSIRLVQ